MHVFNELFHVIFVKYVNVSSMYRSDGGCSAVEMATFSNCSM